MLDTLEDSLANMLTEVLWASLGPKRRLWLLGIFVSFLRAISVTEGTLCSGSHYLFLSEAQVCIERSLGVTNDLQMIILGHDSSDRVAAIIKFLRI